MSLDSQPFYDVNLTYDNNYEQGPFGAFANVLTASVLSEDRPTLTSVDKGTDSSQDYDEFLGFEVHTPFGIPAGPLLNSHFTTAAFRMGFDLAVYKTVRSRAWASNPFPNVLAVHPASADGSLTPGSPELDEGVLADNQFDNPLSISISNSFGVPSRDPDIWQPDMRDAIAAAGPGNLLIPSFQGTRNAGMSTADYVADHVRTAHMVCETGGQLMEMNTSCPNEGHNRLLCHDPGLVGEIAEAVKNEIGDRPLIIKLAYLPTDEALERMVDETVAKGRAQGFATINTISAKLVDRNGNQALPGEGRERSGVCGNAIRNAGLDMVRRLSKLREERDLDFTIVGVGGVTNPGDYNEYRLAGADAVMSATGSMWNSELAHQIKADIKNKV